VFTLISINSSEVDVANFEESDIFKIKVTEEGHADGEQYLCIDSFYVSDDIFTSNKEKDSQLAIVGNQYKTNTMDTFKFIFPKEDEYMELSLCIDSREYIEEFYQKLNTSSDLFAKLEYFKEGMSKVFAKLLDFVRNKLRGKTRSEYAIGEIIPHRQEMIAKVGILTQIFKLLELIHSRITQDMSPKEVQNILEIDSFEFGGLDNLLEVLIRTIHISVIKNVVSASQ
jgi:hypothetical protein